MVATNLGDMARSFQTSRQLADLKTRMAILTREMSSGEKSDVARSLGAAGGRLMAVETDIGRMTAFRGVARDFARDLGGAQTAIGRIDTARQALADALVPQATGPAATAQSGANAFRDIVATINIRIGGKAVFGGDQSDSTPLPDAATMLDELRTAISGAVTTDDMFARIDNWFDDPAGGYATLTDSTTGAARTCRVAEGTVVTLDVTAKDEAFRASLKSAAMAAMADDPTVSSMSGAADDLRREAARSAVAAADPLARLQARVGLDEGRVEQAQTWLTARQTELELHQQEIRGADPFETATALQQLQTQLETQYLLTARLAGLSLVDYLR